MPDFIPPTFAVLALAHFLALLSPGPDFFLIVGHAVRHRMRGTILICAGIAFGNAIYIAVAIAGWTAVKSLPFIYRGLEIVGAIYLLWMGYILLKASRQSGTFAIKKSPPLSAPKQLGVGLGSALLNPKNAVFYLTLMTVIIGSDATLTQQIFSGVWMALVVFLWDVALTAAIAHPKAHQAMEKKIPLIERIAGSFLILLAISFVIVPMLR